MTVSHVLEEVSKAGLALRLTTTGGINARPVDLLTPSLRELLKAYKADLVVALRQQIPLTDEALQVTTVGDELDRQLLEAAMHCCGYWNDGTEARAQMVADIRATPQHHRQELLEHFQAWCGKPK